MINPATERGLLMILERLVKAVERYVEAYEKKPSK